MKTVPATRPAPFLRSARLRRRAALAAALLASLAALVTAPGCATVQKRADPARTGPFFTPANVRAADTLPADITRIVLLPVAAAAPGLSDTTLRELDEALAAALVESARAEVTPISRERLSRLAGRPALRSTDALPPDLPAKLAAETGADAVLFVDLTTYSPYPPLRVGLRARLVRLDPLAFADPLWSFDNVFSAADPAVTNSARAHALLREKSAPGPGDLSHAILQNPRTFADYVAGATWATLPPRRLAR